MDCSTPLHSPELISLLSLTEYTFSCFSLMSHAFYHCQHPSRAKAGGFVERSELLVELV